jgi:uncharacterized protein
MIPLPDGTLRYSPRDLVAYLEGDFAAWCDRMYAERRRAGGASPSELHWAAPDENDPEAALAIRLGNEHEQRWLQQFRERYPTMLELDRADPEGPTRTLTAMGQGIPVIYQAHLVSDGWGGLPDFLIRCDAPDHDCGPRGWHYTPWDTKLARSAKPAFLLQLCAYADLLEGIEGFRPAEIVFIFGHGERRPFQTRHFFYYYRHLRRSFIDFQRSWDAARWPEPGLDRSWGNWEKTAEKLLKQSDHLSLVANITRSQVRRLEKAGITTLSALAAFCHPDPEHGPLRSAQGDRGPRLSPQVLERLHLQARLQLHSRGHPQPLWQHQTPEDGEKRRGLALLPPPSDGDVFFDMEGFPYAIGGLEYLFGVLTRDEVTPVYRDWWAHDEPQERAAFEGFIDWLVERRRRYPDLHVYHYAAYERSTVEKLMGKYATRETEVDELFRAGVFVDLYNVVRQGFVIGTPSYSLKKIEHLYMPERTGPVQSAGGSVVEYQKWIDSGEAQGWQASQILKGIRDYNEEDCESTWALRRWLLERQEESGTAYVPESVGKEEAEETATERAEVEALAKRLVERGRPLDQLVGWLAEFHRREERPMWWRMYKRHAMTIEERYDDRDCLAKLIRTDTSPRKVKRSFAFEYEYDPEQVTKLHAGDDCYIAGTDLGCTIEEMDEDAGLVQLKVGGGVALPDRLCLIPKEYRQAHAIKRAIRRYAEAWERGEVASQAVDDLLRRRRPRIAGHAGPLVGPSEDLLQRAREIVMGLEGTTLCIQGPPGTGKTFTAAALIVDLLRHGRRIGVTSQSHKVILNLMDAVIEALGPEAGTMPLYKVTGSDEEPLPQGSPVRALQSKEVAGILGDGPVLVGGTAWVFSRPELVGKFEFLFIDEAGQVSLANSVAVGQSARNLILVGDQMQLSQVTQGHHPGDTGLSCLEYLLDGHATVPEDVGIFLGESRRMHPDVCRFISEAVYDRRLGSIPETNRHRVLRAADTMLVPTEAGIVWHPVEHDGNRHSSDEECDAIVALVEELLRRRVVDREEVERDMTPEDILIVAPFNVQVRCLRHRLDPRIQVGSVDKFQGREAPVVIVSMCSSTLEEAPRGASFLLSPNRLNVAVSRAQALAIVVGCPDLMDVRCKSVEEMKLVNLLCHLVQYAEEQACHRVTPSEAKGT